MRVEMLTPILNVSSLEASFSWFARFGWRKRWEYGDPADFGAVGNGRCEIFLCEGCQGGRDAPNTPASEKWDSSGAWMSWWVNSPAEIDAAYELAREHGVTVTCPPTDMPWGVRECHVRHPDGHVFRISADIHDH